MHAGKADDLVGLYIAWNIRLQVWVKKIHCLKFIFIKKIILSQKHQFLWQYNCIQLDWF